MDQMHYLCLLEPLRGGVHSSATTSQAVWLYYKHNILFGL